MGKSIFFCVGRCAMAGPHLLLAAPAHVGSARHGDAPGGGVAVDEAAAGLPQLETGVRGWSGRGGGTEGQGGE